MRQNTKDFLLKLAALLDKYKVEIEITESCNGDWSGFSVDGLQFEVPYKTEDGFPLDDYVELAGRFHRSEDIFDYVEKLLLGNDVTKILQFKKEKQSVGNITIDIKTEILEDDSIWYCMKMSTV